MVDRKELTNTLLLVSRALASTDLIPIYKCFAFNNKSVMAYNDTIGIVAPCPVDNAFAVDGKTLMGLLDNTSAETIDIQTGAENDIVIKAARSTFKLPFYPIEEFIFTEPKGPWGASVRLTPEFIKGVDSCLVTSSRNNAEPAIIGISVSPGEGILYSTDGDAISEYIFGAKTPDKGQFMIPNAFCEALLELVEDDELSHGVLEINKEWAKAQLTNGYVLYGRMIENENPIDFGDLIQKTLKEEPELVSVPDELPAALSRAQVVADQESAKTVITIEGGRMKLMTTTSMGVVRDSLAIKHPDVTANVSAALMGRSLNHCDQFSIQQGYCVFSSEHLFVVTGNME